MATATAATASSGSGDAKKSTGYLGCLTAEESVALRALWRAFLQRLDNPTDDDKRQHAKMHERRPHKKHHHGHHGHHGHRHRQNKHAAHHSAPAAIHSPTTATGGDAAIPEPVSTDAPPAGAEPLSSASSAGEGGSGSPSDKQDQQPQQQQVSPQPRTDSLTSLGAPPSTLTVQLGTAYTTEFWNMCSQHHPDSILLRFLRARKWNIDKALDMLWSALRWRVEYEAHGIFEVGERALPTWMNTSGVVFFHRTDKQNRPVIVIQSRLYDKSASPVEENKKQAVYVMELAKNYFVSPEVGTVCVVMDLGQFSMSNFDMGLTKFLISVLEAYYPESLGVVLIMNAPMIFNGIWKMVRPLLDPVVAAKVQFVSAADMPNFIPSSNLLACMGGTDSYQYQYLAPPADEIVDEATRNTRAEAKAGVEDRRRDLAATFTDLTRRWVDEDPTATAVSVVTERDKVETDLRATWWEMDKYAERNLYHRLGVIEPSGRVDWTQCK